MRLLGGATVVAEPTYPDGDHAPVNAALLQAITATCTEVVFAATPRHRAAIMEAAGPAAPIPPTCDIPVLPAGGVRLRRMLTQWRALARLVRRHRPCTMVLLSAGPETLFVARALVARRRALRLFIVMHGNLGEVAGWRSRDPRRRLFDMRSALAVARHPRIRLIVLEPHIAAAAARAGMPHDLLVWPHPIAANEVAPPMPWQPGPRLRLTFVGTASRAKGFDDFLALQRAIGPAYDWSLAGIPNGDYRPEDVNGIDHAGGWLSRAGFLAEVRRADYAVVAFRAAYEFIASGSLLDCIAQRKPLVAVENPVLAALGRRYGPMGHVCADLAAVRRLLGEPSRLRDAELYATFQETLDAIREDRGPAALARLVGRDLA